MVLLNAVYFKGEWKIKFNSDDTIPRPFYHRKNGNEVEKSVPTMSLTSGFANGYFQDLKAKFIQLPYKVNL